MKNVALLGCGFVANYYMLTLCKSAKLRVAAVCDHVVSRAEALVRCYPGPRVYSSLQELLSDDSIEIVINLTNPRDHYETTKACLLAGKHVYTEKPLAMDFEQARELAELATARSLQLSSAPSSVLGEAAQTVWKAVREGKIGKVRLAYAEIDDGLVHKMDLHNLKTRHGAPWPAKDEFEIGCTLEHAGYYLPWLAAIFGPAKSVTAFATALIPDKLPGVELSPPDAPDLTVACIEFANGAAARLTCSVVACHDHSLRLFGDEGVIHVDECWNFAGPVRIEPRKWNRDRFRTPAQKFRFRAWRKLTRHFPILKSWVSSFTIRPRKYPLVRPVPDFDWQMGLRMDFSRGIEELADAIDEKRQSRLSTSFCLHATELVLAIHHARRSRQPYKMATSFEPMEPMAWAK